METALWTSMALLFRICCLLYIYKHAHVLIILNPLWKHGMCQSAPCTMLLANFMPFEYYTILYMLYIGIIQNYRVANVVCFLIRCQMETFVFVFVYIYSATQTVIQH